MRLEVIFFTLNFYSFWIGICLCVVASTADNCNHGDASQLLIFANQRLNRVMGTALAFVFTGLAFAIRGVS